MPGIVCHAVKREGGLFDDANVLKPRGPNGLEVGVLRDHTGQAANIRRG